MDPGGATHSAACDSRTRETRFAEPQDVPKHALQALSPESPAITAVPNRLGLRKRGPDSNLNETIEALCRCDSHALAQIRSFAVEVLREGAICGSSRLCAADWPRHLRQGALMDVENLCHFCACRRLDVDTQVQLSKGIDVESNIKALNHG